MTGSIGSDSFKATSKDAAYFQHRRIAELVKPMTPAMKQSHVVDEPKAEETGLITTHYPYGISKNEPCVRHVAISYIASIFGLRHSSFVLMISRI